jgi:AraC-like DNA-binding protein
MEKTVARFADGGVANALLRDFRLNSWVLCRSVMAPPWGFGVAGRDKGSFHIVLEGRGWLEVVGVPKRIRLQTGDLAVLPRGSAHWIRDAPATAAPSLNAILAQHHVVDGELHFGGEEGPLTEIVCGVFTLDGGGPGPWLDRLPPVVIAKSDHAMNDWRYSVAVALRDEARAPTPGGATVVNRLIESLLADALRAELVRHEMDAVPPDLALLDRRIGIVLNRLHQSPESQWGIQSLASVAAMSRSTFSERFRSLVGEAPMRYLKEVRLARAARLLRSTDATVAEVARSVGYASEAALSRAFKARFGDSPSLFRRAPLVHRADSP